MAHIPTKEADVQKVYRIAKELGISLEDAAVTCAGFELAFSDDSLRREIFGIIGQLDDEAAKKGEPLGLIISYAVELQPDGIRVGRYADEIPPGEVVNLTPTDRAMIFLKIKDNFPTQQFLGPLIVNRPELESVPGAVRGPQTGIPDEVQVATGNFSENLKSKIQNPKSNGGVVRSDSEIHKLPSLAKEGWQTDVFCRADGVVCSDSEINKPPSGSEPRAVATGDLSSDGCPVGRGGLTDSVNYDTEIPNAFSRSEPTEAFIWNIPTRLTLDERFPFLSAARSQSQRGFFLRSAARTAFARPLLASLAFHSGLSPPPVVGEFGHSASKDVPPALAIDVRDTCLTF